MKIKMILWSALIVSICLLNACTTTKGNINTVSEQKIQAFRPPMGWNSYNSFGATVRENEVRANADFLADKLSKYGWENVVIDFCWFYPHHPKSIQDNPPQFRLPKDGSYVPWLPMDEFGRLLPDPGKFPSCDNQVGFKPLADYVHSLGLKFGIHIMRGIPRQAVWDKTPIYGSDGIDASMIADTLSVCSWLNTMYGLDMSKDGSQQYLNSLFKLYAGWGVDYVKIDDLSSPYYKEEIEGYKKAIELSGRPMVLSTSPGATPLEHGEHVMQNAQLWRVSSDFWDNWPQVIEMFELAHAWTPFRGPGHWPDLDMLQLGRLSRRGPVGDDRDTNFTPDEQYTHMTLWSIARSPLMMGGDLTVSDDFTIELLSNDEIISVNQYSTNNRQIINNEKFIVWMADDELSDDIFIAIFNVGSDHNNITINLGELGIINPNVKIRDMWAKEDIGSFTDSFTTLVNSHGSKMYRLTQNL